MSAFPAHGRQASEIAAELAARRAEDPEGPGTAAEVYWPVVPEEAMAAGRAALDAYAHLNAFSTPFTPGFQRIDRELRGAVADLFSVPSADCVTITAGGTEGNFLAVRSAREWARGARPTAAPTMVLPRTAHPSFDKAGLELGVAVRRVEVLDDWRADPAAIRAAIDDDAILVVASLPSYPHGAVDDIPAVAAVAAECGVWMHVDAAVGGFLAPHMREIDPAVPPFGGDVAGVRSITADLHKLGFCLNGISTFTVADPDDRQWARYSADVWPRGGYVRQGFLGSRPAGVVAAAWAVVNALGRDGYGAIARDIAERQAAVARGLEGSGAFRVVAEPRLGIMAVEPTDGTDVGALIEALAARGWDLATNVEPPSIQIFPTPALDVDLLLDAFADAHRDAQGRTAGDAVGAYGEGS